MFARMEELRHNLLNAHTFHPISAPLSLSITDNLGVRERDAFPLPPAVANQRVCPVLTNSVPEFHTTFASPLGLGRMHYLLVIDWITKISTFWISACIEHDANNPPLKAQFVPYYPTLRAINQKGLDTAADDAVFVCLSAFRAKCLQRLYSRWWRVSMMWPIRCDLAASSVCNPFFNEGKTCWLCCWLKYTSQWFEIQCM